MKKRKVPRKVIPPYLNKWVNALAEIFEVKNWDKNFYFPVEDKEGVAAEIDAQEDYQRIYITIYPSFFRANRARQREYLLHEYCHIITQPLVDLLDEFKQGKFVTPQQIKTQCERATSRTSLICEGFLDKRFNKEVKAYKTYLKLPTRTKTKLAKSKAK